MISSSAFPHLAPTNHRITSPADVGYNCIAWSAGDTSRWWQPGMFWPATSAVDDYSVGELMRAFEMLGYQSCDDASLEGGFEKVAIYGSTLEYTHAARQLPSGKWTSKRGKAEDIEHDRPEVVADGLYGPVLQYLKRPLTLDFIAVVDPKPPH